MPTRRRRNARGAQVAEFAAVLVLGIPLLIGLIYMAIEVAHYFAIKSAMDVGARNTARALVINYNNTTQKASPAGASVLNGTGQTVTALTIPNYINNGAQYSVNWDTANPPNNVTVDCTYPNNGAYGLSVFPNFGPIHYFAAQFLPAIAIKGTFTCPVQ